MEIREVADRDGLKALQGEGRLKPAGKNEVSAEDEARAESEGMASRDPQIVSKEALDSLADDVVSFEASEVEREQKRS